MRTRRSALRIESGKEPSAYGLAPTIVLDEPDEPPYPVSVCGECVAEAVTVDGHTLVYCEHNHAGAVYDGSAWTVRSPLWPADWRAWISS